MDTTNETYSKLLYDFLSLNQSYLDLYSPTEVLVDYLISDTVIARDYLENTTINYLFSPLVITIPNCYFRLFTQFDIIEGSKITYYLGKKSNIDNRCDYFIKNFLEVFRIINTSTNNNLSKTSIFSSYVKIVRNKTVDFREFLKTKLNINFPGWYITDFDGKVMI